MKYCFGIICCVVMSLSYSYCYFYYFWVVVKEGGLMCVVEKFGLLV